MALKPGQRKCIETLDKPIVVAAGAGSGKTFTLTKRIVGALESGYIDDIGQVCAITFTNKAAAELKSRVKAELRAVGLVEQSLKADDAWISTIHGMCARILRAHAIELDLDPKFKMIDEGKWRRLRADALEDVLKLAESLAKGASDDGRQPVSGEGDAALPGVTADDIAALFAEYPARPNSQHGGSSTVEGMLETLIGLAGGNLHGADAFKMPAGNLNPARILQSAADLYADLVDAAELLKSSSKRDTWLVAAHEALDAARQALSAGSVGDARQALQLLAAFTTNKQFGARDFKSLVDECITMRDTCIMELRLAAAAPLLRTLVVLARTALVRFQDKKRREGVLDNDDLLVLASKALEEHPEIAAAYADKFQLVMVDEFQDTDQMQVDMIKRIAGPGACRLCTVGDAQQSIYRFRGADVSVYRRHLGTVRAADPDSIILLPDNFRSHADVLSLVDCVFARPDMFGGEFMSLAPGRDEAQVKRPLSDDEPRVQIQQVTRAYSKGASADEAVCEQARQVAAAFAAYHAAGHPAGDMAVLLGRMKHAGIYAQALRDVGLACVVSGGSVFRETPEANLVVELARAAVNAADTQALWNVLAGPIFRVPDDDLLALSTGLNRYDGLPKRRGIDVGLRALRQTLARMAHEEGPLLDETGNVDAAAQMDADFAAHCSEQMRCAARVLGALQRAVGRTALSRALMCAVIDSGWISRLESAGPEGLAGAANVYKAIRMVEEIEAEQVAGPVGVMRALEEMLELAKEAPGALSTEGGDFVRIMTVHASKGLEFPIVAVSEFREGSGSASGLLALDAGDTILLSLDLGQSKSRIGGAVNKVDPAETVYPVFVEGCDDEDALKDAALHAEGAVALRAALCEYDTRGEEEESKRLLYVALTRAKEALVVSLSGKRSGKNPNGMPKNCLAQLVSALSGTDAGFDPGMSLFDFGGSKPAVVSHEALEKDDESVEAGQPAEGGMDTTPELFPVPAPTARPCVLRIPYADAHEGIFSYSSVANASHEGDLLPQLAGWFAVSCDAALPDTPWLEPERPDKEGFLHDQVWENRLAAMAEDDDGSWAYLGASGNDSDKATDFGTAFHRLAQYAVEHRVPGALLAMPPASRIRMMMRTCGLDGRQWSRLDDALERWFGSDEARRMEAWPGLQAEVPFFVALQPAEGDAPIYLEGEIDLLAVDRQSMRASVVDYKTGGHPAEEEETLRQKHVLQASCYALSLLRQGMEEVEASFVRVERPRADDPHQPQCVRYRFTAADMPTLEQAIAQAYALARRHGE